jgi:hypothetical protein
MLMPMLRMSLITDSDQFLLSYVVSVLDWLTRAFRNKNWSDFPPTDTSPISWQVVLEL